MSSSTPQRGPPAGATPHDSSHGVRWIRPERGTCTPPPLPEASAGPHETVATIVIVLTMACTALASYDLFLLTVGAT